MYMSLKDPRLGGGSWLSSGPVPRELPTPKDASGVMVVCVIESKGGLQALEPHTEQIEEAGKHELAKYSRLLGITSMNMVLLATSGFPGKHFHQTLLHVLLDAVSKWMQVVFVYRMDPDSYGRSIASCVLDQAGPFLQHHRIVHYEMTPVVGDTHVCQILSCVGGIEAFCPLFSKELVRHMLEAKAAESTPQVEDTLRDPYHGMSPGLAEAFDLLFMTPRIPHPCQLQPQDTAAQIPLGIVARCTHGETRIVSIIGPDRQRNFEITFEHFAISCPMPLPLGHVVVLRTVLPQDTTLLRALKYVQELGKAISTSDPQVKGMPKAKYYVVPTSSGVSLDPKPCQLDVVRNLANYLLGLVDTFESERVARQTRSKTVCDGHDRAIATCIEMLPAQQNAHSVALQQQGQAPQQQQQVQVSKQRVSKQKQSTLAGWLQRPQLHHHSLQTDRKMVNEQKFALADISNIPSNHAVYKRRRKDSAASES